MLTRLKVNGFKNLIDVDVRFGPFTCIAGANGIGKSNLFDAVRFLSALAGGTLLDASRFVRDDAGKTSDILALFHHYGNEYANEMSFVAEMIVPKSGSDDLGQVANASITFLQYSVTIAYRRDVARNIPGYLELVYEDLRHINLGDARDHLPFEHKPSWRRSAITGRRTSPFISTEIIGDKRFIKTHQDGISGRPLTRSAENFPRTALSVVYAAESPTALLAKREMQSWRLLQLEPSALRKPDDLDAATEMGSDGSHLPASLYQLAKIDATQSQNELFSGPEVSGIYSKVANRLSELVDDVRQVWIDRDETRRALTLQVTGRDGTSHPARALSDGTLRFLALAVLELDTTAQGLLCLEEPENGIHPERIRAMLRLLQDIATDTNEQIGADNPLRQVIINTHSPAVVMEVPEDSLLVAEAKETVEGGKRFKRVCFSGLPDTWRYKSNPERGAVSISQLLAYLQPVPPSVSFTNGNQKIKIEDHVKRVYDRADMQMMLPGF